MMKVAVALVFACVCAVVAPQPAGAQTDYVIGPQDVLTVTVYDHADLSGKFTVEADGTLTFPLIGRVKAAGLTLAGSGGGAEDPVRRRVSQEPAGGGHDRRVPEPARLRHG